MGTERAASGLVPLAPAGDSRQPLVDEDRASVLHALRAWTVELLGHATSGVLRWPEPGAKGSLALDDLPIGLRSEILAGHAVTLPDQQGAAALWRARRAPSGTRLWLLHGALEQDVDGTRAVEPILLRPVELQRAAAGRAYRLVATADWQRHPRLGASFPVVLGGGAIGRNDDGGGWSLDDDCQLMDVAALRRLCGSGTDPASNVRDITSLVLLGDPRTLLMLELHRRVAVLAANDLIASIAGSRTARERLREQRARTPDLDAEQRRIIDTATVTAADPGQRRIIEAVVQGQSVLVEGQAGTGKSETIVNVIAVMLAAGKRVAFVAGKEAGRSVVTDRLHELGLGSQVLDVAAHRASTTPPADLFARAISDSRNAEATAEFDLAELTQHREVLEQHLRARHERRSPWGWTVADAERRLLEIGPGDGDDGYLDPRDLVALGAESFESVSRDLAAWASPWRSPDAQCWSRVRLRAAASHSELVLLFERLDVRLRELEKACQQLAVALEVSPVIGPWKHWRGLVSTLGSHERLLRVASPALFDLDLDALAGVLHVPAPAWSEGGALSRLGRRQRAAARHVRALLVDEATSEVTQLAALVSEARCISREWSELVGPGCCLPNPAAVTSARVEARQAFEQLDLEVATLQTAVAGLPGVSDPADLAEHIGRLDESDRRGLVRRAALHRRLAAAGLRPLVEALGNGTSDADAARGQLEREWLQAHRTAVLAADPRLNEVTPATRSGLVARLVAAEDEWLRAAPLRVRSVVRGQIRTLEQDAPEQVEHVLADSARARPWTDVRRLVEAAPDALLTAMPCLVLDPLEVAELLPPGRQVDLVVIDEAGQLRPAEAVAALGCAPRALVVGDRTQLPPSAFFRPAPADPPVSDHWQLTHGFTSIADVLRALLPTYRLSWNHRAADGELVGITDRLFHGGEPLNFAAAESRCRLQHVVVAPVSADSDLAREADRVVDLVVEHRTRHPDESLAVITFGRPHAQRIARALRSRARHDPGVIVRLAGDDGSSEGLLLRSVEAAQGHERDAVILATGYANRGPGGELRATFGPLTSAGGERRLQVALTRARQRLTVVTSFTTAELDATGSTALGIRLFRRLLNDLVDSGGVPSTRLSSASQNPLVRDVLAKLDAAGLPVRRWRGDPRCAVDLEVVTSAREDRGVLAIGTDDERYMALGPPTVRDFLVPGLLRRRGWAVHRIAGSDWIDDPEAETARVFEAYRTALGSA